MATVRFLFDEHMPGVLIREVRRRGMDVLSAIEAGLLSQPDTAYLTLALATGRVVVTMDSDFVGLHYAGHMHAGIIYFDSARHTFGEVIEWIMLVHGNYDSEQMLGRLERL